MATARSRRGVLAATIAVVSLFTVFALSGGIVSGLKSTGRVVVAPFSWAINVVAHPIADLFAGAVNYSDVVRQNRELRSELGRAQMQVNEGRAMRRQLDQIAAATQLPFVGSIPIVVAQVTTNSPTNFSASITISKGASSGLLIGMPVVANGGLLGRIESTTPNTSVVRLITDQTSIVGATFGNGSVDALIYGRGVNNALEVSAIAIGAPLTPGTIFATNGLQGGLYPPGLPVARVRTITLTPGSAAYDLTLNPSANLSNLSYIDVLLWEPST